MPPIRADHGLSRRKTAAGGADEERERAKQPRRGTPVTKRSSPSHSRTPSPNLQAPASSTIATVHATTAYGHVGARRKVSSPSSKAFENGGGPRNRSHAHTQRPHFKVAVPSWGVSSPTPGASGSGRAASSPTRPSGSSSGRGHASPTLASRDAAGVDGLQLPAAAAGATSGPGMMPSSSSSSSSAPATMLMPPAAPSVEVGAGSGSASLSASREMTPLDRVFLGQPHAGRQDVEGDDLHVSNEIQRHLKTRVQSQQSQLMEAMESSSSSAALLQQPQQQQQQQQAQQPATMSSVPAVVCGGSGADLIDHHHHGPDLLLPSTVGVTPVSPSSGSGPVQGKDDMDAMDFPLYGSGSRGGGTCSLSSREPPSPSPRGPRSRSPSGPPPVVGQGAADVQMSEAGGGSGGGAGRDGQLREVVNGLDAMELDGLDDLHNIESALAVLNAKRQQLIAKKQQAQQQQQQQQQQEHPIAVVPSPPPPQSSNGGSSRAGGGGSSSSRQRRSSGRATSGGSRHGGGESSPSTVGGRSEAFGVSCGGSVRGSGGGGGGGGSTSMSSVSYSSGRGSRGQQGRPPPVPGHLSASTAAMRRSSPGSIASLAELDSYLEHHHRRLVEQVEGGVVADDVEAEIRASRQCRRGTRSHHRFGGGGSFNGFGSSSSSGGGVPRTVGAGLSTDQFFDSTVSADGYGGGSRHHYNHHSHHSNSNSSSHNHSHQQQRQFQHHQHQQHQQHQQRVPAEWTDIDNGIGNGNGERSSSGPRGWDSGNNNTRGQGHKRERPELRGGGADGGWGASLRGFRGGGRDADSQRSGITNGSGDMDCGGSAFMGVSGTTSQTSSPPPSIMSSDDVSVSSYGHPVTVLPGSPNNMRFDGRPPPSLAKIRLEAVRSPVVRRNGGGGGGGRSRGGRGAGGLPEHGGPVFTSPDATKHVQELCSPRSAFTPRSASSVSSLASSRGRR